MTCIVYVALAHMSYVFMYMAPYNPTKQPRLPLIKQSYSITREMLVSNLTFLQGSSEEIRICFYLAHI